MPRTPAKHTQADIARSVRAMKQVFGSVQVVHDVDGNVRVVPVRGGSEMKQPDDYSDVDF